MPCGLFTSARSKPLASRRFSVGGLIHMYKGVIKIEYVTKKVRIAAILTPDTAAAWCRKLSRSQLSRKLPMNRFRYHYDIHFLVHSNELIDFLIDFTIKGVRIEKKKRNGSIPEYSIQVQFLNIRSNCNHYFVHLHIEKTS
jgi:hypothetical protein